MNKDIKDYLHLYLGCEYIWVKAFYPHKVGNNGVLDFDACKYWSDKIKITLRPLSDITEDERQEAAIVRGDGDGLMNSVAEAYEFKYLLSKGFDLFGLIESGLAIDKTKLPSNE